MAITAADVMKLREATGLGMMDCKKALTEADGNMELAIENLRKKGQATAAKRADRDAKEGTIAIATGSDVAAIYEVNCETDFVARNDDFIGFVGAIGKAIVANKPANMDAASAMISADFNGLALGERTIELVGKIGEKIGLRRFALMNVAAGEYVSTYIHSNNKIGVIVKIAAESASEAVVTLGKDLAMHIAAAAPLSQCRSDISADLVAKEKEIYLEQVKQSGKPEKIWDNIVEGKLAKYFKGVVLLEQDFVKDPDINVSKRIEAAAKEAGSKVELVSFIRFALGDKE